MKFTYQYKTSENERREGEISAASRDEVYRLLKKRGVHPFNVELAPGLFNRIQAVGKRGAVIALLVVALVVALVSQRVNDLEQTGARRVSATPRHQLYGDPSIIEEMEANAYVKVFSHPGERFLAFYAQPGRDVRIPLSLGGRMAATANVPACLTNEITIAENEPREITEVKQMVLWLKDEVRSYLENGDIESYLRCLDDRQAQERQIYKRAVNELKGCKDDAIWIERNRQLRELGLRTVAKPKERKIEEF